MDGFVEIGLDEKALEKFGLPNVGYPVPVDALMQVMHADGNIDFSYMLYWCQAFCSITPDKWPCMEPAMRRLTELIAPQEQSNMVPVEGDFWALHAGKVNLDSTIVTIQRQDDLMAAIMPHHDGTLVVSVYRPLDALSIRRIIDLSRRPHPEYGVQMRDNNWEFALDASAHTTAAFYACENGHGYLSYWEHGLGIYADGNSNEKFVTQRNIVPMSPDQTAVQLGVFYQLCSDVFQ